MDKRFFILFCLLMSFHSFGQYNSEGPLISRFRPGSMWWYTGLKPADPEKLHKYDRLIFDLTYNTLNGKETTFKNHWKSLGLNTNLLFDLPLTKGNTVSIGTGLCHSIYSVRHDNQLIIDSTATFTLYQKADSISSFDRSSLVGNVLSIPLELRLRTKSWRNVKIHLGGKVGYQLNQYNKSVYLEDDGKVVLKNHNYPDINRLVYSVHARIGIRNWALFGSYNLNPVFSNSKSTKLHLLQFGLSISLF